MDLSSDPATHVVIVSGRDRHTLGDWLGQLDVGLVAEHGAWMRDPGREWRTLKHFKSDWKQGVMPILQQYADRLPGAFVEEKDLSLGWHYRNADPDQAKMLAAELTDNIVTFTANIDVHVLQGNKVVEVRNAGVDKGIAALEWLSRGEYDFVLGVGDDWTDEDLFKALSDRGISIRVGLTRTHAQYNLRTPADVIALLESLLSVRTKANGTSVRMSQDPQVRSK
jgi:trehalose 6-phosphate synthase/phosphatase